jgi:hypothetical protein
VATNIDACEVVKMKRTGFRRPGAILMVAATALIFLSGLGPLFIASTRPSHEWLMILTGAPAIALFIAGVCIICLYVVGFLRYSADKGYSSLVGLWLLLGNVFGLIAMLLLPDKTSSINTENFEPKEASKMAT